MYLSGNFVFGKTVVVKNKSITFFLGGGVATYLGLFGSSAKSDNSVWDGNSFEKVFEYEMMLSDNKVKGFTDAAIQLNLNYWNSLGFRYRQHFSPGLTGTYHYYHTPKSIQGRFVLDSDEFEYLLPGKD